MRCDLKILREGDTQMNCLSNLSENDVISSKPKSGCSGGGGVAHQRSYPISTCRCTTVFTPVGTYTCI
jgi:hypothetical protein